MKKLQLNIISKFIFIIMLVPLYTSAALSDGNDSEENSVIHIFFHLPPDTQISATSSALWHSIKSTFTKAEQQNSAYCGKLSTTVGKSILSLEKRNMLYNRQIPLTLNDDYPTVIIVRSHAKTIIEFEDVQVAITKFKLDKPEKKTFHITPTSLKNADNTIKFFSYPKLKNLPQPHICLQYGDGLQDDPLFVLKNYPLTEGEEGYVSNYGPKTTITFSKLNRTYLLPKDFHENDKAAFLPLAPDQFLAVTPTKACVLEDNSENTDDDDRFLIVKEIPCFEESTVMLNQGGEGYCLETSSIAMYDDENLLQTYYYDQTEVDICELPPAEKLPISILWPTDDQRAQAEKSIQPDSTGRQDREQKPLSQQQEKSSTGLEQQNAVASTSEAQNFE